jgi:hypothetical protein
LTGQSTSGTQVSFKPVGCDKLGKGGVDCQWLRRGRRLSLQTAMRQPGRTEATHGEFWLLAVISPVARR